MKHPEWGVTKVATVLSDAERKPRKRAYEASPGTRAMRAAYRATPGAKERKNAQERATYAANPGKDAVRKAAARAASPEKYAARNKARYAANIEKEAERKAKFYAENKEKVKARVMAYRAANPGKHPAWSVIINLRKYGLTVATYEALATSQNGSCAICKSGCVTGKRLAVDHCHESGRVRGLLCFACNTSLGKLKDSPAVLATALRYLAKHGKALATEEVDELTRDLHHYT